MSSPQKGICTVCGTYTGDRRRSRCDSHANRCRVCGQEVRELRHRYCRSCGTMPHMKDARRGDDNGLATVRRLFALRRRAEARLPLFERSERAKAD